jgi:hypothetical protein
MLQLGSAVLVVAVLLTLPGCGGSEPPAAAPATGHYEGDGHDHEKEG